MKNAALGLITALALWSAGALAQRAPAPSMPPMAAVPAAPAASGSAAPSPAAGTASVGVASSSYVLGPDDVIEVSVLGRPEMTQQTRIKPDGTIVMPLLGTVKASGETILTLADRIAAESEKAGLLRKPIVNVEVVQMVSKTVTVLGRVTAPGTVPIDRTMTVSMVLGRVGGALPASAGYVIVQQKDGSQHKVIIDDVLKGGANDPQLLGGETLYVPDADIFYIYGQISSPGPQALRANMTVRQAIAQAGGPTQMGSDKRYRVNRGGKKVDLELDDPIQKDDVIVMKERIF